MIVLDRRNLKTVLIKNFDTVKDGKQEILTGDEFSFYKKFYEANTDSVTNERTGVI